MPRILIKGGVWRNTEVNYHIFLFVLGRGFQNSMSANILLQIEALAWLGDPPDSQVQTSREHGALYERGGLICKNKTLGGGLFEDRGLFKDLQYFDVARMIRTLYKRIKTSNQASNFLHGYIYGNFRFSTYLHKCFPG